MQEPAVECDGNPTHAMIRMLGYFGLVIYAFGCAALPVFTAVSYMCFVDLTLHSF